MTEHTKGPWIAGKFSSVVGWPVVGSGGRLICDMAFPRHLAGDEAPKVVAFKAEVAANARLIAAAPDLLEALQTVDRQVFCDCFEGTNSPTEHQPGCFVPILRAAIAKATGANHD